MKHCDTCKHWERSHGFDRAAAAYGEDDAVYPCRHGFCERISTKTRVYESAPSEINPAVLQPPHDEPYLLTLETFGCTLHEEGE